MSRQTQILLIMKNFTFLAAVLFLTVTTQASAIINSPDEKMRRFNSDEPIVFTERGIEFYVFSNGEFDFNTQPSQGTVYYKNGRRSTNTTYGAPVNYGGIKIEHDYLGRVRRIGNVFVNYDASDRIKRIGSVYMTYNRFALSQVGNLKIVHNRRGEIIDIIGQVKGYSYGNSHGNSGNYYTSPAHNDNDYYYYKTDGTKVKIKEEDKTRETGKNK